MAGDRAVYEGGHIGHRDAFRLTEPDMSKAEYQAYRTAWWQEFPCSCDGPCLCQGPPPARPPRVRLLMNLPDEPPSLAPAAARVLLRILMKAAAHEVESDAGRAG